MVVVDVAGDRGIDVEDICPVGIGFLQAAGVGEVAEAVAAVELQGNEGDRDGRRVGRAHHAAGGLAYAEVGGQEPDDVHARAGVGAGERGRVGALPLREIVDPPVVVGLDRQQPELAVAVLRPVALEGPEAGDAARATRGRS